MSFASALITSPWVTDRTWKTLLKYKKEKEILIYYYFYYLLF